MATTKLSDLINPEVLTDMVSAKLPKKLTVTPFANVDRTLEGREGNTITVPQYAYIGDATDIAEGAEIQAVKLEAGTTQVTVKKAGKAVEITDEAMLSAHGNPLDEATNQLAKSIASKVDADGMKALFGGFQKSFDGSGAIISYNQIVDAIDLFEEEFNSEKVMFVAPAQVTQLRKDSNFISADKYNNNVIMTGEIGKIANCRIVPSKRVEKKTSFYKFVASTETGALKVVASGASTGEVDLADVTPTLWNAKVGDYVKLVSVAVYFNPIVKLNNDTDSEDDAHALTIYLKRNVEVEPERKATYKMTVLTADEHYAVAVSNTAKLVMARIKQSA